MNLLEFELTHGDEVDRGDDDVPPEALARPLGDGRSLRTFFGGTCNHVLRDNQDTHTGVAPHAHSNQASDETFQAA